GAKAVVKSLVGVRRVQAQEPGGHVLRRGAMFLFAGILAGTINAQQTDPATKWATGAQTEYTVTPNVVYQKANNIELHLDLITTSKPTLPKPTVVYIH